MLSVFGHDANYWCATFARHQDTNPNDMEAQTYKPKNAGKKELMGNRYLEYLTRTHIAVPISMYVGMGLFQMGYALYHELLAPVLIFSTFVLGVLVFTLIEYLMHKHVFHMNTDTAFRANIQYKFHGVHHEYPKDKGRLAMPPVVSILLAVILFYVLDFTIGNYLYGFMPGFLVGYSAYLFVHYAVHAFRPPNNFLKILWVNHGIHHYKSPDKAFGVSSPLWDVIFRTMP